MEDTAPNPHILPEIPAPSPHTSLSVLLNSTHLVEFRRLITLNDNILTTDVDEDEHHHPFLRHTVAGFQYYHLLTKDWQSIGIGHLLPYGPDITFLYGINTARYVHSTEELDKGSFHISSNISSDVQDNIFAIETISELISQLQQNSTFPNYFSKIFSLPSLISFLRALLDSRCDIIIPMTMPFDPSPSFFHSIFVSFTLLLNDTISLLQSICVLYNNKLNDATIPALEVYTSHHTYIYAQPSNVFMNNDGTIPQHVTSPTRPLACLINIILDDGSTSVFRVTNGIR